MHSVEIKKLDLNFGSVNVLHNLDLNVHKGEFLVLLGSSGCGKSTFAKVLMGLETTTEGEILLDGKAIGTTPVRRRRPRRRPRRSSPGRGRRRRPSLSAGRRRGV